MRKSELLKQGNYLTVIKPLAHFIGLEETIIIMELVGMEEYKEQKYLSEKEFCKREGIKMNPNKIVFYEEDRFFVCTSTELELATTIKERKQNRILNKLEELNLIKVERRGLPSKRFIQLNHDQIEKTFNHAINNYQDFKDEFFKEKKLYIKKKQEKNKIKKAQKQQFRQNDGTSSDNMTEHVPTNQRTLNNTSSIKISPNNNNLYLNLNTLDTLWNVKLPMELKQRIKVRIYENKLTLTSKQILEIEEAYFHQLEKGYIKPDCDKDDPSAINDYEFSLTVTKMLDTVSDIKNIKGLIQAWVLKAYDYKGGNVADNIIKFYNWLELHEETG